jgi:hypothetical protein
MMIAFLHKVEKGLRRRAKKEYERASNAWRMKDKLKN